MKQFFSPYQTLYHTNLGLSNQVYNLSMSPRHFANYAKENPKGYAAFSDSMWNGFVSITKYVPIINRFFSFTPDFLGNDSGPQFFDPMNAPVPQKAGDQEEQNNSL